MNFFNIFEKFTPKQTNVIGNFAEVLAENQSKNVYIIIIYIMRGENKVYLYNQIYMVLMKTTQHLRLIGVQG